MQVGGRGRGVEKRRRCLKRFATAALGERAHRRGGRNGLLLLLLQLSNNTRELPYTQQQNQTQHVQSSFDSPPLLASAPFDPARPVRPTSAVLAWTEAAPPVAAVSAPAWAAMIACTAAGTPLQPEVAPLRESAAVVSCSFAAAKNEQKTIKTQRNI